MIALGWSGLLPFYACAALAWWQPRALPFESSALLLAYSLAIACFLCGTLWSSARDVAEPAKSLRLLVSNGLVLLATGGVVFASTHVALAILMLVFWLVYAMEWLGAGQRGWYLRYRFQLTCMVSIALLAFLAAPVN
ncbi:MAG: DUF3429 domain-containing protein [Pseudomonadota bacterium]